ncbi:MAG: hypothetical protein ACOX1I_09640 [Dethiobacteria bacterium]
MPPLPLADGEKYGFSHYTIITHIIILSPYLNKILLGTVLLSHFIPCDKRWGRSPATMGTVLLSHFIPGEG